MGLDAWAKALEVAAAEALSSSKAAAACQDVSADPGLIIITGNQDPLEYHILQSMPKHSGNSGTRAWTRVCYIHGDPVGSGSSHSGTSRFGDAAQAAAHTPWHLSISQCRGCMQWERNHMGFNFDRRKGDIGINFFKGATTNMSYNCLDRNVKEGRGSQICFLWEGNDIGTDRRMTYQQVLDETCRVVRALRKVLVLCSTRIVNFGAHIAMHCTKYCRGPA